jgi:Protein of unknown function (DUF4058)
VIEVAQSKPRAVSPNVSRWRTDARLPTQRTVAVIDPPLAQSVVPLEVPVRLARVEVRDAGAETLVTAIDILSPMNKHLGRERRRFLRKRRERLRSEVHVMEYERGGYATRIDYRQPVPPPPLEPEQQAWVEHLLAAHRQ